jgi:hypothetical protein
LQVILQQSIVEIRVQRSDLAFEVGMLSRLSRSEVLAPSPPLLQRDPNIPGVGVHLALDMSHFRSYVSGKIEQITQLSEKTTKPGENHLANDRSERGTIGNINVRLIPEIHE